MLKKNLQLLVINIAAISLFIYLSNSTYSIRGLLNITFYFVLVYMVLSLALYTIKGGFYDGMAFGFRRFLSKMSKGGDGDPLEEWREKPDPSQVINRTFYRTVRFQFLALSVILALLLVIYYS